MHHLTIISSWIFQVFKLDFDTGSLNKTGSQDWVKNVGATLRIVSFQVNLCLVVDINKEMCNIDQIDDYQNYQNPHGW